MGAALAQDCPNLGEAITGISAALNDVDLETARSLSLEATAGLLCQPEAVNTVLLTSLYQLSGAIELYMGETDAADILFERAVAVSPLAQIDPMLGADAEAAYDAVRAQILETPGGTLRVDGRVEVWLDGRPINTGAPHDVTVGNHLLQWKQGPEEAMEARIVRVSSGEGRSLPLGSGDGSSSPPPRSSSRSSDSSGGGGRGASVGLLAGGGFGVVAGGVLIALAGVSHNAFENEPNPHELEAHQTRTNALAISGMAVGAIGVAAAGVGVVVLDDGAGLTFTRRW